MYGPSFVYGMQGISKGSPFKGPYYSLSGILKPRVKHQQVLGTLPAFGDQATLVLKV